MAISAAKVQADVQEIVFNNAVKRGVDMAKTKIVSILGCSKVPVKQMFVGRTDVTLKPGGQPGKGYTVHGVFVAPTPRVLTEVETILGTWLKACHGAKVETCQGGQEPVRQGNATLYLAVK